MKRLCFIIFNLCFTNAIIAQDEIPHIPISSYNPDESTEELNQLSSYFENAKLIGLGESTHGTSEFTLMRHKLFRFLVEEHGYNTIFLEEDYATCLRADAYIKGAEDDPSEVVKSFNQWPWMTQELADLIEWMREYNANTENEQLSFIGVDIQYFKTTLDVIDSILISYSPTLKNELTITETTNSEFMSKSNNEGIEKFEVILKERKAASEDIELSVVDKKKLNHLTRGLKFIIEEKHNLKYGAYRDVKMAENIMAHFEDDPQTNGIFWAHNTHILNRCENERKGNCRTGANLKNWMGDEYYSIALDFDKGAFNAYYLSNEEGDKNDIDNYTLGEVSVDPAIEGSVAYRLRKKYDSVVFMPTGSFTKRKDRKISGRTVGASFTNRSKNGSQTIFEPFYVKNFDAIIVIKNTSATELLVDSAK
ncbi:erythromycin esterase family protein [Marivirga salinae]|uniref:Erythromycin esterase family protein n=1 Tax=Marivirga salinarum TaxID=3059078 RepID=A0AA51R978_9BACT|nr:erythromycin esterase family protein [Marivirga sp. BDSF4-3]WMN11972.1 erythromycin esterase family protein [Marivirga sp. BDSF4-3]